MTKCRMFPANTIWVAETSNPCADEILRLNDKVRTEIRQCLLVWCSNHPNNNSYSVSSAGYFLFNLQIVSSTHRSLNSYLLSDIPDSFNPVSFKLSSNCFHLFLINMGKSQQFSTPGFKSLATSKAHGLVLIRIGINVSGLFVLLA